jgi:hypothetical protein
MSTRLLVGAGLVTATLFAQPVWAASILGGSAIVSTTGEVKAVFVSGDAGFDNELYLDSPANGLGLIFQNHVNAPGDTVSLGVFDAGTELIFRLFVLQTGDSFFTGGDHRNPDNLPHAYLDDSVVPGSTLVGFEDLFGGGDFDYNDTVFRFTNVFAGDPTTPQTDGNPPPGDPGPTYDPGPRGDLTPTPEPMTFVLSGSGLAALIRRRMRG